MRKTDKHTFFFTKADVFSNWHPSWFTVRGIRFNCVEGGMEADAPPARSRLYPGGLRAGL